VGGKVTDKKLTPQQWRAVETLMTTGNVSEAASAAGCSRKTVYAWMQQQDFAAALKDAERLALSELSRNLAGLAQLATDTLRQVLTAGDVTTNAKLRAAETVIGNLLRVRELVDFEERLQALEGALSGNS